MGRPHRCTCRLAMLVLLTLIGCSSKPAPSVYTLPAERPKETGTVRATDTADHLLEIVKDDRIRLRDRAEAAYLLGKRRSNTVMETFIAMLPGEDNALTLEIIVALGRIGDPRALPVL